MSRSGEISLDFGGEERTFRLGVKQWEMIDDKCGAGPAELLSRLAPPFYARKQGATFEQILGAGLLGTWKLHDVRETILQGLLGANMAAPDALKLVRDWVDERPLIESAATAYQIVLAGVAGVEAEEPLGESRAAAAAPPISPTDGSASARTASTRSARRAASAPNRLTP